MKSQPRAPLPTMAELPPALAYKRARAQASGLGLNVDLRRGPKGVGLYATKRIPANSIIAYYVVEVRLARTHRKLYSVDYSIGIPGHPDLIGDLCLDSLPPPSFLRGRQVPYWAYFSNEPAVNEAENAGLYPAMTGQYAQAPGERVKVGQRYRFKLVARSTIQPKAEIVWCYGDAYHRSYDCVCQAPTPRNSHD